ncbi:predicted protein [Phaeodactylum tricornutum CCAP 1055/1]|uniref:Uncharacterized protein n=1 Tax=Phaeodactylum tricornutum (strain CCAP 1055/1) TaxID=556484 RepID=B7G6X8_PHATC|nr:predicted protein [Phaeodactylum tricornutum CCAP 1055/1]EEC45543.1 predicted protein [Phaeodactylum tricornutum CCAP 1055/1]|eukprot:XP_002182807.1 predicted protein [Phaeodactylum tricornutum CCAP 1055/1]
MVSRSRGGNLVPIRVDAFYEDDKKMIHIRLVDTLLLDPQLLPLPHSSLEENTQHLAYTMLSDAEVLGMGRTVRHFTGRLDLWSHPLQQLIADQIRPQLQQALSGKRVLLDTIRERNTKKVKLEGNSTSSGKDPGSGLPNSNSQVAPPESAKEALKSSEGENTQTVTAATEKVDFASKTKDEGTEQVHSFSRLEQEKSSSSSLIPIRLRLSVHGVRIHDDFLLGPSIEERKSAGFCSGFGTRPEAIGRSSSSHCD